jgi:hypothetical protein
MRHVNEYRRDFTMLRCLSTSKNSRIPARLSLPRTMCVASGPESQNKMPCKTKRPAVGEAWSGRTSPSGSAPWESPPEIWGAFFLAARCRRRGYRPSRTRVGLPPSDGLGRQMRAPPERRAPARDRPASPAAWDRGGPRPPFRRPSVSRARSPLSPALADARCNLSPAPDVKTVRRGKSQ